MIPTGMMEFIAARFGKIERHLGIPCQPHIYVTHGRKHADVCAACGSAKGDLPVIAPEHPNASIAMGGLAAGGTQTPKPMDDARHVTWRGSPVASR